MPNITFTFGDGLNVSAQVGDTLYYAPSTVVGNVRTVTSINDIVAIGPIVSIDQSANSITADWTANAPAPSTLDFFFFSKTNIANMASAAGYYMEVKMENNSSELAKLFGVNTEFSISSK